MRPQDFHIKARASEGIRVDLVDPAGNREWMRIRSVLSEEFAGSAIQVTADAIREGFEPAESSLRKLQRRRRRAVLAASLVAESSLPHDDAALVELLIQNPKLRRQVERIAENTALFMGGV